MPIKTHKERIAELEKQNQKTEFEIDELKKDFNELCDKFANAETTFMRFMWNLIKWGAGALIAGVGAFFMLMAKKGGIL